MRSFHRFYSTYALAFGLLIAFAATLESLGFSKSWIGYLFLLTTALSYAAIGMFCRTHDLVEYHVAGRSVPAFYNGMAMAADWMSSASFISLAGVLYLTGHAGLAYIIGWTGGFCLLALFLAPYLRRFGGFTIPDFLAARYGGRAVRIAAAILTIFCSFIYLVAQFYGVGLVATRMTGMVFEIAIYMALATILVCSFLGGMRAITWTQVAQYIVLIVAYLVPVMWLSVNQTGNPIAQMTYGQQMQKIQVLEARIADDPKEQQVRAMQRAKQPLAVQQIPPTEVAAVDEEVKKEVAQKNFFALIFCLTIGTAALPHILTRAYTTTGASAARRSVAWALFFILLLYLTAPALAAFAKYEIYAHLIGTPFDNLPAWIARWSSVDKNLVSVTDVNKDGILQLAELTLSGDVIVLAVAEIGGLPYVVSGMVAAGALAAALSTADGLLLTISNALSHDIYYKTIDSKATPTKRVMLSKTLLMIVAVAAAYVAAQKPADILFLVSSAFSFAASAFFPALVLAVFWRRANRWGALAGMVVGFGVTLYYMIQTQPWLYRLFHAQSASAELLKANQWWDISPVSAGLWGVPAGFLAVIIVSWLTEKPGPEAQAILHLIRSPDGAKTATQS